MYGSFGCNHMIFPNGPYIYSTDIVVLQMLLMSTARDTAYKTLDFFVPVSDSCARQGVSIFIFFQKGLLFRMKQTTAASVRSTAWSFSADRPHKYQHIYLRWGHHAQMIIPSTIFHNT